MNYCGFDLGKRSSHFHIVDGERKTVTAGKLRNNVEALRKNFAHREPMHVVVEASCKAFWIGDRLKDMGHDVVVVDPGRTKAISAGRIKHDKLDARVLAELCQTGLLSPVDIPSLDQRMTSTGCAGGLASLVWLHARSDLLMCPGLGSPTTSTDRWLR